MKHPFLLQNFIEKNDNVKSYENKFAVVDLSKISSNKRQYIGFEQLLEIRGVLMVTRGEVNIVIDSIPYDLTENRILILEGQHIVSRVYFSDDCAGHCLIFDNDYLEMLVHEGKPPRELMTNIRLNPVIEFSNDDFAVLRGVIERIYADLIRSNHAFLSGIFDNALRIFNYELWNAILNNRRIKIDAETPYEQTAAQFIKLLHDNFRTRHELSFYAATLCVSTVFLTRAMKQATKKTAGQWVDEILTAESKILLRKSGSSIKKTAEELHFSDQASFSKFFKKNTGLSPVEYKKKAG